MSVAPPSASGRSPSRVVRGRWSAWRHPFTRAINRASTGRPEVNRTGDDEFRGTIGRFHRESTAWWPAPRRAAAGTPNVLLIVLDDVGFAQLGCFGSDIDTPALDGLAANGLRYSNFHTTALCSPTRA